MESTTERRQAFLEELMRRRELCIQQLRRLPRGGLSATRKNGHLYYNANRDNRSEYLRVGDPRIQQLQDRHLAEQTLKAIDLQIKLVKKDSNKHIPFDPNELLRNFPQTYRNPSSESFRGIGFQDARIWAMEPYEQNQKYPEQKKITTDSGLKVRSRVEAFILKVYEEAGIPVRYEEVLVLPDGQRIYPDVHPLIPGVFRDKRHEHCGRMEDSSYVQHEFLWKQKHYAQAGLVTGRDVLFTFDFAEGELHYPLLRQQILNWIDFCRSE